MVVTVGVDVHKHTHCAVAVDEAGRQLGKLVTVRATDAGHLQLVRWASREFAEVRVEFAVEDCRHVSTRLERALLAAGQVIKRVPPKLMAGARQSAWTRGKSDPIDALAIARACLREPNLPTAEHDDVSRELKLLVDHREDLVNHRTEVINRLRWHLHELDPAARSLDRSKHLDRVLARLAELDQSLVIVRVATELVADIRELTRRESALEREIAARVKQRAPQVLEIPGCGVLTAAKLVAETANPSRFRSEACFAMHAGAAPIPASSGKTNRHRLARGGNRQLNAALHRIAVTQIRLAGDGRDYYLKRKEGGNTTMEALRALKRKIARRVSLAMNTHNTPSAACQPQAA